MDTVPKVERSHYQHTGKVAAGTDTDLWSSELSAAKSVERHGYSATVGEGSGSSRERKHCPR